MKKLFETMRLASWLIGLILLAIYITFRHEQAGSVEKVLALIVIVVGTYLMWRLIEILIVAVKLDSTRAILDLKELKRKAPGHDKRISRKASMMYDERSAYTHIEMLTFIELIDKDKDSKLRSEIHERFCRFVGDSYVCYVSNLDIGEIFSEFELIFVKGAMYNSCELSGISRVLEFIYKNETKVFHNEMVKFLFQIKDYGQIDFLERILIGELEKRNSEEKAKLEKLLKELKTSVYEEYIKTN